MASLAVIVTASLAGLVSLFGSYFARVNFRGSEAKILEELKDPPILDRRTPDIPEQPAPMSEADIRFHLETERIRIQSDIEERRYRLLRQYSSQGLAQSQTSFLVNIVFSSLGFLVIMVGVVLAVMNRGVAESVIPVVSGTVVNAVGALFSIQDRRARGTMEKFFDKLRDDRKLDDALALISGVPDDVTRSRLQALLALHFANVPNIEILFNTTVDKNSATDPMATDRTTT
ncbi:hypothetical protein [Frankia sp. CiP3]|uniref:TRADD-N-associated membrane domain-containing protein n=1 Tax=Frankia sp. CiP3 TaxID=2880971 RepID=UPI0035B0A01E